MDDVSDIEIYKFLSLKGEWRIDWLGNVDYSTPLTSICRHSAVPIYIYVAYRKIWLPIGLLPLIKVGDLWSNSKLVGRNTAPSKETFHDVIINDQTSEFYKASRKPASNIHGLLASTTYWLPLDQHPCHLEHTHSNCIIITLNRNTKILIPCMKLIGFYFGSSTSLLSILFKPMLNRTILARPYIKRADDSVFLRLAEGISGASAADIARILYFPAAWRAATLIGKSVLQCSSMGGQIYPKCTFPFEGLTDLNVAGQWITHDGSRRKTFVVYEIMSCSHKFPFKSIRYVTTGNSSKFKTSNLGNQPNTHKNKSSDSNTILLTDSDPDENRQTRHVQFISASSRFPDLETKTIFRDPSFSIPKDRPYSKARGMENLSKEVGRSREGYKKPSQVKTTRPIQRLSNLPGATITRAQLYMAAPAPLARYQPCFLEQLLYSQQSP